MQKEDAEWHELPCSQCTLNDDSPNNQGQSFVSLDALIGERGEDFDESEAGPESIPMGEWEQVAYDNSERLSTAFKYAELSDDQIQIILPTVEHNAKKVDAFIFSGGADYYDELNNALDIFVLISRLPSIQKRAVEWKLNDPHTSFTELAEELEVTPQFVNQQYLKCLQETPVLAHIMKNRSSKVERYKSQHVNDAQALGDIMKGLK